MLKKTAISMALVLGASAPALAQNATCTEPTAPAVVDGSTVSRADLVADIAAVKKFLADSDTYQLCLNNAFTVQKDAAAASKTPLDPSIEATMVAKVAANQKAKDSTGASINAAIAVYKKTHPGN